MQASNRIAASSATATFCFLIFATSVIYAQTTAFTYQGKLNDAGNPANGTYDLQFRLFDALAGGNQVGQTAVRDNVPVTNGIFSVSLDFGAAAFPGANRFLEIAVRAGTSTGAFTTLSPLHPITSSPYAIMSLNAATAITANGLSAACNLCVTDAKIANNAVTAAKIGTGQVVKSLNNMTDNVTLAAGSNITITPSGNTLMIAAANSGNAILNQTTLQAGANFNIGGAGTASVFNATTQYNLGGNRILSNPGMNNLFVGVNARGLDGANNATAIGSNAFANCSDCMVLGNASSEPFKVGIGTTSPTAKLHVVTVFDDGVRGVSNYSGVHGISVVGSGVLGESIHGIGVEGKSDDNYGMFGKSNNNDGVRGESSSGNGIMGISTIGNAVRGTSTQGRGVFGSGVIGVFGLGIEAGVRGLGNDTSVGVDGNSINGPGVVARSKFGNLIEGYSGDLDPGPGVRKFHIMNNGTYVSGSDFAEALPASGSKTDYEPGDVLVVSTKEPGKVEKAARPYDGRVAGVYSTRPGMLGADKNGMTRVNEDDVPVAIVGIVPTKVSAKNGPIRVGDLLTTSSTPGYAMRCANRMKCVGAVVGKALEPLASGKGVIKVMVMLR